MVLNLSTSPVLTAFGSMKILKQQAAEAIDLQLQTQAKTLKTGRPWLDLLCSGVLYAWKHSKSYFFFLRQIEKDPIDMRFIEEAFLQDERFQGLAKPDLHQLIFRANVYCIGMGQHAARGFLYKTSQEGIIQDLREALSHLLNLHPKGARELTAPISTSWPEM